MAEIVIGRRAWHHVVVQLRRRGKGHRESGAFLLGQAHPTRVFARVTAVAFYDDLDPYSLTGGITFHADGYSRLGDLCRAQGLQVVADIHTHPGRWTQQSWIDASNPMVAIPGHVALIVPNYADGRSRLRDIGVHVYEGGGKWCQPGGNHDIIRHPSFMDLFRRQGRNLR